MRIFAVETIAYVISWTAYPLIMFRVTDAIGRETKYVDFIVAYNWSKVLQMAIYLPVSAITFAGVLPETLSVLLNITASIGILIYQWFITRTALEVAGLAAGRPGRAGPDHRHRHQVGVRRHDHLSTDRLDLFSRR